MDYQKVTEEQLIRYIGGGAQPGSQVFEGCQAELNRRLSTKAVDVSQKALWVACVSAFAAFCSAFVAVLELFFK